MVQNTLISILEANHTFIMISQSKGSTPAESIMTWDPDHIENNRIAARRLVRMLSWSLIELILDLTKDDMLPNYGRHYDPKRILRRNIDIAIDIARDTIALDKVTGFLNTPYGKPLANDVKQRYIALLSEYEWDDTKKLVEVDIGLSELYYCGSCGSRAVVTMQKQTRSSDESGTIFIRCTVCGALHRISA